MDLGTIPTIGWIVLAFVAVLIFIVLLIIVKRGVKLGLGNNSLSLGQTKQVDKKIDELKIEIKQKEIDRLHDEEFRKMLFRKSGLIDEKEKADKRRVIRKLDSQINDVFKNHVHCEMPLLTATEAIKDVLFECVDYNNMREKLSANDCKGYLDDILYEIQQSYEQFLQRIISVPCSQEIYPIWDEIKYDVEKVVKDWALQITKIMIFRINEKITMYEESKEYFILPEYVENSCNIPIKKNQKYIKELNAQSSRFI